MQKKTTVLNPYLTFEGNCGEAMNAYKAIFGGTLELMCFKDAPMEVDEDDRDKIMHAVLKFGDATLMASDGRKGQAFTRGDANWIMVSIPELDVAEAAFKKIQEGGSTVMGWSKTFWNSMFGMCVDKFGIGWMIACEIDESNSDVS